MSPLTPDVSLVAALCLGIVAAATALAALVARTARRTTRTDVRRRTGQLVQLLAGRLSGRVPARTLNAAAREVEADHFWDAMEAIAATLRRSERLALAESLARNRHVSAERRILLEDDAPARRERAAHRLGLLPSPRLRGALRRALVAGPEPVRLAAGRALATLRDAPALHWICAHPQALATRPLPALSGLLRAYGPGSRAHLITALDRGIAVPHFECAMLDALGVTRCRSARERIEARLHGEVVEVRVAAARALGRLGMAESIPALIIALGDPEWPARAQAAHALGRLRATPAVEALAESVGDTAWWVRRHAAYALAAIGSEGHDALCELATRSPDPYAREMAREALDHALARNTA